MIQQERDALAHKQKLTHDEDNPSCPLCEQNLSASRKRFLRATFCAQEHFLSGRFERLSRYIKQLKELLVDQHTTITELKKQHAVLISAHASHTLHVQTRTTMHANLQATTERNNELHKQILALESQEKNHAQRAATCQQQLITACAADPTYQQLITQLQQVQTDVASSAHDQQSYQQTQQQLAQVEQELHIHAQLTHEVARQAERVQELRACIQTLKKLRTQIATLTQQLNKAVIYTEQLRVLDTERTALKQQQTTLVQAKEKLLQEKGTLHAQQKTMQERVHECATHEKTLQTLTEHIDDYQAIALATGKDGIQALLIEQALPEIEEEANNLLAKLTNNQAHIIIESLRDLQKGGTKETLDINISDAAGIRPYELFSGGEAFRIDFALRIAISKLLARRAGTSLQTLIIDEGFGSQDEEGLSHIMDAIHTIRDDFAKVIIVSHLHSMKDQFPVHFYVEKRPQGSIVTVLEQG